MLEGARESPDFQGMGPSHKNLSLSWSSKQPKMYHFDTGQLHVLHFRFPACLSAYGFETFSESPDTYNLY